MTDLVIPKIIHTSKEDLHSCMTALLYGTSPTKLYRRVINDYGDVAIASNLAILELVDEDFSPMTYDLTDKDIRIINKLVDDYHHGKVKDQEEVEND